MSQVRPLAHRVQYLEDILHRTGWGLYYKFMLGYTCFNSFANAMMMLALHFALPLATCDTLEKETHLIILHVCFNLGRTLGAFIICSISDFHGRKCMIPKSLLVIFGSGFVMAFSHSMYTMFLALIFLGSGLEANMIITKIHLIEILPVKRRGFYTIFSDLFWTCGYFVCSFCMYTTSVTNTSVIESRGMDMRLTFWRFLFALAGGLTLTMACVSALLEASPRYLLYKKRLITATLMLKQFYAINKSKYSETFEIYSQDLYNLVNDYELNIYPEPAETCSHISIWLKVTFRMMKVLFSKRFLLVIVTITLVKLPGMFGIISLNMFLARNFDKSGNHVVSGLDFLNTISVRNGSYDNCTATLNEDVSKFFLIFSANIFVGQFFLMFVIDGLGRKIPIFMGLISMTLASFVLAFKKNEIVGIAVSSVFTVAYTTIESALNVVAMESFPTALRGTAIVQTRMLSYVVVSFIYLFLCTSLENLLIVMAILSLMASMLYPFIPEMKQRPMIE